MSTGTVKLHHVFPAPAERVYRPFLDPAAIAKWLPPYGFVCVVDECDPRVGGKSRMAFKNFSTQKSHAFSCTYTELKENERIRYIDKFDDPNLPGEMSVTITFKKVLCGTEMTVVQEGIPSAIPVEMCYLGWQESLAQLERVVNPNIPDGP